MIHILVNRMLRYHIKEVLDGLFTGYYYSDLWHHVVGSHFEIEKFNFYQTFISGTLKSSYKFFVQSHDENTSSVQTLSEQLLTELLSESSASQVSKIVLHTKLISSKPHHTNVQHNQVNLGSNLGCWKV